MLWMDGAKREKHCKNLNNPQCLEWYSFCACNTYPCFHCGMLSCSTLLQPFDLCRNQPENSFSRALTRRTDLLRKGFLCLRFLFWSIHLPCSPVGAFRRQSSGTRCIVWRRVKVEAPTPVNLKKVIQWNEWSVIDRGNPAKQELLSGPRHPRKEEEEADGHRRQHC